MVPATLIKAWILLRSKIIENGQLIVPDKLTLLEPGMRLIVAINEGPTLANRYAQVSRIDKVKTTLIDWAKTKTISSMDDFNLITNSGIITSNSTKPTDWVDVLNKYQPDMKKCQARPFKPVGCS